jgi:hypothetical protein
MKSVLNEYRARNLSSGIFEICMRCAAQTALVMSARGVERGRKSPNRGPEQKRENAKGMSDGCA